MIKSDTNKKIVEWICESKICFDFSNIKIGINNHLSGLKMNTIDAVLKFVSYSETEYCLGIRKY